MKHRIFTLILILVLALGLTVPAAALEDYDYLSVAISEMDNERLQTHGMTTLPTLSGQYGFDLRVNIVDAIEGESLEEYADSIYETNGYGYGANCDGSLLMIQVADLGGSVDFVDYAVIGNGHGEELLSRADSALLFQSLDLTLTGSNLDYASAGLLCADAVDTYAGLMYLLLEQVPNVPVYTESELQQMEAVPSATASLSYILDNAGLLSEAQQTALEEQAQDLAEAYDCGVYVLTVDTMDGAERREFAEEFYTENHLGVGEYRNGILFLVCMDTRDYVTVTYGRNPDNPTEYGTGILAFTDAGIAAMEEEVVPLLSTGDYSGAFETYLATCEGYLAYYAEHGEGEAPADGSSVLIRLAIGVLVPLLIALTVCLILRSQMKTARAATTAKDYIPKDSFVLTARRDQFVHTSQHREKIQKSSGSGSTVSSSGFGGSKGGKF